MEKFDKLENKMIKDYEFVLRLMGDLEEKIKHNPENNFYKESLYNLGTIAEMLVKQRIEFIDSFCPDNNYSKSKIDRLEEYRVQLMNQLKASLETGRSR